MTEKRARTRLVNIYVTTRSYDTKGVCKRCGGAKSLLRPTKQKLLTFVTCTDCAGRGVRFKACIQTPKK